MDALLEGGDGRFGVGVVGSTDRDGIEVFLLEHFLEAVVGPLYAMFSGISLRTLFDQITAGDHFTLGRETFIAFGVASSDATGTDDADF